MYYGDMILSLVVIELLIDEPHISNYIESTLYITKK